ncbi:MAG: FAD-binding oxidoreductase [Thermosphaera sp.]
MKADVVIIGAGVTGVLTAAGLMERGVRDIVIVEKSYPGSGGSFRCATGIRASFTSIEHVEVMKRAIELWPQISVKHNIQYSRDGYLWVLTREKDVEFFRKVVDFHNSRGVPTKLLDPSEVKELVPLMRVDKVLAAVHDPLAGKANCFEAVLNPLRELRRNGVKILQQTRAQRIIVENNVVKGVETNRGSIMSEQVLVAAGGDSRELLQTAGVDLPIKNLPKHVMVTETFKKMIKPLIIDWATSSYILQLLHGNFYLGADIPETYDSPGYNRLEFLKKASKVWTEYFPWLKEVYVLRYWTGYYDMTPDHHPIIGPIREINGLYVAAGFSGHGFMMAPAVAEALADYMTGKKPMIKEFEALNYERFRRGELIKEIAVFG